MVARNDSGLQNTANIVAGICIQKTLTEMYRRVRNEMEDDRNAYHGVTEAKNMTYLKVLEIINSMAKEALEQLSPKGQS